MITKKELGLLRGLTDKVPSVARFEKSAVIYSRWFVLEVPLPMLDPTFDGWEEELPEGVKGWRLTLPPGEGDYAQVMRWTNPEDNVALIKLIADSGVAFIHPSLYEVVTKQLPEPEFRVFPGDKPFVAIRSEGVLVGGTAQVKL